MEVYLCDEFDGDGYKTFAVCKTIEKCKEECINHLKDLEKQLTIKNIKVTEERIINITYDSVVKGWEETFYICKMPVLE